MPDTSDEPRMLGTKKPDDPSIGELIEFIKAYALQETVGPLRGAGRWMAYGVAAALTMGLGLMLVLLGVLRLIQTELDRLASGSWSWAAYAVTLVITLILLVITVQRVKKTTLNNEPK